MSALTDMIRMQLELQQESYGIDPTKLEGQERIDFIHWNITALTDELHEVLGEVGWKPWATSRHVNEWEAQGELIDAWHFFMNLLLATAPRDATVDDIVQTFITRYLAKRATNAKRQAEGYDGVTGKCPNCKRDLAESACTETICADETK